MSHLRVTVHQTSPLVIRVMMTEILTTGKIPATVIKVTKDSLVTRGMKTAAATVAGSLVPALRLVKASLDLQQVVFPKTGRAAIVPKVWEQLKMSWHVYMTKFRTQHESVLKLEKVTYLGS